MINFSSKIAMCTFIQKSSTKKCVERLWKSLKRYKKMEEIKNNSQHTSARTSTTTKQGRNLIFLCGSYAKKGEVPERSASNLRAPSQQPPNTWPVRASRGRIKEGVHSCLNVIYTPLSAKTPKGVGG